MHPADNCNVNVAVINADYSYDDGLENSNELLSASFDIAARYE